VYREPKNNNNIIVHNNNKTSDPKWFKLIRSADMGDNWVHKFNNLKKLYKLISRYLEEKLSQSLVTLDPPDLNTIAKDGDAKEILKLCGLVIAVAVQCDNNQYYIQNIQTLPQYVQRNLMLSLENVSNHGISAYIMKGRERDNCEHCRKNREQG
jgi:protein HOOK3